MPVTAKLSRAFYEKLGDEVTNELVNWLNAVDASYRQEFRDLFEATFGQVRAEMAALRAELKAEVAVLRAEMKADMAGLEQRLNDRIRAQKQELLFWMFLFWVGTVGAVLLQR